jgi:hypothetical protein
VSVEGETRRVQEIVIAGQKAYVLARNNDSVKVIRFGPAN